MELKKIEKYYQEFQGKKYWLQKGENYLMSHKNRLHRVVWEFHNGPIPEGYDIHHKDGNKMNNDISNLNCLNKKLHGKFEMKKRMKENPEWFADFQKKGIEKAKDWHKSPEGLEWHRKHAKNMNLGKPDLPEKDCPECGEAFKPTVRHQIVCSNKCKARARRKSGIDDEVRICVVCKDKFIANKYSKVIRCKRDCK